MGARLEELLLDIELEAYTMTKDELREAIITDAMYLTFLTDEGKFDLAAATLILLTSDCNTYKTRMTDEEREAFKDAIFGPAETEHEHEEVGYLEDCLECNS